MDIQQLINDMQEGKVVTFIPETATELAIVDLNVLKRLASMLPKTDLESYKVISCDVIGRAKDLKTIVEFYKQETAFHETVNLITSFKKPEQVSAVADIMSRADGYKG